MSKILHRLGAILLVLALLFLFGYIGYLMRVI